VNALLKYSRGEPGDGYSLTASAYDGSWDSTDQIPERAVDSGFIAFNNDVSDSWQWADDPRYPAEAANLGLRIGVNLVIYSLTH
jgi:hypothetical protein